MTERAGRRRRVWALVAAVPAFCILLALGFWQLDRLEWKRGLIDRLAERGDAEAIALPEGALDQEALEFRKIRATGSYLNDRELFLGARTHEGASGFEVVTPFRLDDGREILINRGWVPPSAKDTRAREDARLEGEAVQIGIARSGGWKGASWLKPENDPAGNLWIWPDLPAMVAAADLANPVTELYLVALPDQHPGAYPLGRVTGAELRNDHLQYALTWFSLAAILVAITGIFVFRGRGGSSRG